MNQEDKRIFYNLSGNLKKRTEWNLNGWLVIRLRANGGGRMIHDDDGKEA